MFHHEFREASHFVDHCVKGGEELGKGPGPKLRPENEKAEESRQDAKDRELSFSGTVYFFKKVSSIQ